MKWLVPIIWILAFALAQTLAFSSSAVVRPLGTEGSVDEFRGPNESPLDLELVDVIVFDDATDKIKTLLQRYVRKAKAFYEMQDQWSPEFEAMLAELLKINGNKNSLDHLSSLNAPDQNQLKKLVESAFISEVGDQASQAWRATRTRRPTSGQKSIRTMQGINMRMPPRFGKRSCQSSRIDDKAGSLRRLPSSALIGSQ